MPEARAKDDGRIRLHPKFKSPALTIARDVVVYLPPNYESGSHSYPVLYLQDGQNLFDPATAFGGWDWGADIAADRLIRAGLIEPLLIVGVYNTGARRISEYTPTHDRRRHMGGDGPRYSQMLAHDLKRYIDGQYRTLRGRECTAAGGSSLGALVSLEAGLLYPKVFGKLAVLSPSVWWDNRAILRLVNAFHSRCRPRIWLDCGTNEGHSPAQMVKDTRMLRDALSDKGWRTETELHYAEFEGAGHNEGAWGSRFGDVLRYLFPK